MTRPLRTHGRLSGALLLLFAMAAIQPTRAQAPKDPPPQGKAGDNSAVQAPAKSTPASGAIPAPMSPDEARQAQYVADTTRLLQLAQELKAEVDKSSKDTLSIGVVRKAAEVEKLAKSLKERMRRE